MSGQYHERLTAEFLKAAALPDEARAGFMDALRATQPDLCAEVESLLRHDGDAASILDPGAPLRVWTAALAPGDRVGPYHVLEEIGAGGMGVVYRAERRDPVRYEVALKLIKPGLETERVLSRFEAERAVLALLDHPGIARVFDAGLVTDGRPYVAMEYVRGEPITHFCDRNLPGLEDRLRLFLRVCEAVHHAHQNGIIHRDIKPSNVLVTVMDGTPVPKVIDFGIARAVSRNYAPGATLTVAGELIGTPAYMSPEQASAQPRNIDVRADVYSLGALLYELLAGGPPFEPARLPAGDLAEARRVLLEEDPVAPSRRVLGRRGSGDGRGNGEPAGRAPLARRLAGDLDAIVLKALAKEPALRYGSASELADDIRRHLDHEPIAARAPSAAYRLRKLVRRHRTAAAVIAATVPLAVGSGIAVAFQAHRVALERDRAEEISEFVVGLYGTPYFQSDRHGPSNPQAVLVRASDRVRERLGDRPLLQARLQHAIGETLRGIGALPDALRLLEASAARLSEIAGATDPATLAAESSLAHAYADQGRHGEAEPLFRRVLENQRRAPGPAALDTLRTMRDLGFLYKMLRRGEEASQLLGEAAAGLRRALGDDDEEALVAASLAASVDLDLRRLDEAEALLSWAIPRMKPGLAEKGMAVYNLGCVQALKGDRDAALRSLREAAALGFGINYLHDLNLRPLRADPEFVALASGSLAFERGARETLLRRADFACGAGREDEAEAIYRFLLEHVPRTERAALDDVRSRLAAALYVRGRFEEARPLLAEAVESARSRQPVRWGELQGLLGLLFRVDFALGDHRAARRAIDEAIDYSPPGLLLRERPPYVFLSMREAAFGDPDAAIRWLERAVDHGFDDLSSLQDDRIFRRLHGRPAFEQLVALVRQRSFHERNR